MKQAQRLESLRSRAGQVVEDGGTEEAVDNAQSALNMLSGLDVLLDCPDYRQHVSAKLGKAEKLLQAA